MKYGIELVAKEGFTESSLGVTTLSRLIIRETNSSDDGRFFFQIALLGNNLFSSRMVSLH